MMARGNEENLIIERLSRHDGRARQHRDVRGRRNVNSPHCGSIDNRCRRSERRRGAYSPFFCCRYSRSPLAKPARRRRFTRAFAVIFLQRTAKAANRRRGDGTRDATLTRRGIEPSRRRRTDSACRAASSLAQDQQHVGVSRLLSEARRPRSRARRRRRAWCGHGGWRHCRSRDQAAGRRSGLR